jgi:hypothetical protein
MGPRRGNRISDLMIPWYQYTINAATCRGEGQTAVSAVWGVRLHRSERVILGSNPRMFVLIFVCPSVICGYRPHDGLITHQRNPTKCLNRYETCVWGGWSRSTTLEPWSKIWRRIVNGIFVAIKGCRGRGSCFSLVPLLISVPSVWNTRLRKYTAEILFLPKN